MRAARVAVLALPVLAIAALGYASYYTDALTSINSSYWTTKGSGVSGTAAGLNVSSAGGGSVISTVAVPDGSADYDVAANLTIPSSGGLYAVYLRASQDAIYGSPSRGTFYAVTLSSVAWNNGTCTGYLQISKYDGATMWGLTGKSVACRNGMELHSFVYGTTIQAYVDGYYQLSATDASIGSGKPGVGGASMPAGNGITNVLLRPIDRVAPAAVVPGTVATFALPRRVELQWKGADDGTGIGISRYAVYRDGTRLGEGPGATFSDEAVQPSTSYTYAIYAADIHNNWSGPTSVSVPTPPDGAIDSRRVGVRPDGAYWGGGDEQIDTRSGNLNFSIPLIKAQGRGGWGVTFSLNYNSQMWRTDAGGDWKLGNDTGYGHGWRLMAGAVLPYYNDGWVVHHYKYIDSTGAEYRLEINTNGVWTSQEWGVYVAYDAHQRRLYFPDGTFWLMGAESSGAENDAGTLYPTVMQDTNGNQLS